MSVDASERTTGSQGELRAMIESGHPRRYHEKRVERSGCDAHRCKLGAQQLALRYRLQRTNRILEARLRYHGPAV